MIFQKLGIVHQRAHLTSGDQQALPASSHHTYTSQDVKQTRSPAYSPSSASSPGENTRQATHNKLTTEPAVDPLKIEGEAAALTQSSALVSTLA